MPPRKRAHSDQSNTQRKKRAYSDQSNTQRTKLAHSDESNTQRRTKRTRGSDLSEVSPNVAVAAQTRSSDHKQNLISVDLRALSTSITTTISQAIQQALGTGGTPSLVQDPRTPSILPIEGDGERSSSGAIQGEITAITQGTQPQSSPRQAFSSIAIALGSRVNPKIKAKIWGSEYVDFGGLLSLSPNIDRYTLSLTPSNTSSNQPQLTLEPSQPPKRIHSLNQWLSAFNTFVTIYVEKYPPEASKLMKYCEVVRDIASKPDDWSFYDEQFRYGSSVNDHIPEEFSSVRYASISHAISVIKQLGAGCFMAKTDIKSAFRIIPFHPKDNSLLGMKWANQYYYDPYILCQWDVVPAVRFSNLSVQLLGGYENICLFLPV
ncbi:hypothetical protein AWC38_SpisGene21445 [Stylophora pistillata]|uniref:Uncharacterized protein n=1 Tax=Stylophora pistillata TaxID=50429 RepID=A0A2B4R9U0_STYPI|nr:hypothetical protein AWC38_SpisGene21445 [Stylophora pistillata]